MAGGLSRHPIPFVKGNLSLSLAPLVATYVRILLHRRRDTTIGRPRERIERLGEICSTKQNLPDVVAFFRRGRHREDG